MLKSMTGYGSFEQENENVKIKVEIKSVNHRYGDITIKAPRQIMALEDSIKRIVSATLLRGKIDVFVNITNIGQSNLVVEIDEALAVDYFNKLQALRDRLGISNDIRMSDVLRLEDVVRTTKNEMDIKSVSELLLSTVESAVNEINDMRVLEGSHLLDELTLRINNIEKLLLSVEDKCTLAAPNYLDSLKERIAQLIDSDVPEMSRLELEAAIIADKADVTEETTRIHSHLLKFREFIQLDEPVGRKLDFLIQEFNREVNTIGSKAYSDDVIAIVIDMKAEIEKLREQIQNIE